MTTYAPPIGTSSPLPEASWNPQPIIGATAIALLGQPLSQGILPQVSWNTQPITGAQVIAVLFPTFQGGSFGVPI